MQKTQLQTSKLGATGLEITRIGFGAWTIGGGGWEFGWGSQDDEESLTAIQRAVELGVNWIERLRALAERMGTTPGAAAIAWTLRNPAVDGAIVGFRQASQVDPLVEAANLELTDDAVATIEGRG